MRSLLDGLRTGVASPRRSERGEARERIREAAERLFAERGYEATSVRDVTAEAGCNLAAVSYHFGGKDELYREVCRGRLRRLKEARAQAAATAKGARGGPPVPRPRGTRKAGAADGESAESVLQTYARAFLGPFEDPREGGVLLKMWLREAIDPRLPEGEMRETIAGPAQVELAGALREVVDGLSERAAMSAATSFTGQLIHHVKVARLLSREPRLEGPLAGGKALEPLVRFAAAGARALATPPPRRRPRRARRGARSPSAARRLRP